MSSYIETPAITRDKLTIVTTQKVASPKMRSQFCTVPLLPPFPMNNLFTTLLLHNQRKDALRIHY